MNNNVWMLGDIIKKNINMNVKFMRLMIGSGKILRAA